MNAPSRPLTRRTNASNVDHNAFLPIQSRPYVTAPTAWVSREKRTVSFEARVWHGDGDGDRGAWAATAANQREHTSLRPIIARGA